jgi:signal transduction histidine kinase/DNA-binding response OmpR family regulator
MIELAPHNSANEKPARILIVDDERTLRTLLSTFLGEKGFEPFSTPTAEEGLALMNQVSFDIALVDIKLPGMDGIQMLHRIKEISPETEVVIITSHASLETSIEAIRNGAYEYLVKPFDDIDEVLFTVKRAHEKRQLSLRNKRLLEDLKQRNETLSETIKRLTSLTKAGHAMSSIHSIAELLDYFIELVTFEFDVSRASLMLMEEGSEDLFIVASRGLKEELVKTVRVKKGEGIAGKVAQSGKPVLVKDIKRDSRFKKPLDPDMSDSFLSIPIVLSVPIKMKEKVLGVINVTNRRSGKPFDEDDMAFLMSLAGQAAVAVERTKHFEELQQAYESLKSTHSQLVASERLNAVGQMAAGIAHDFNNILSGILGKTQLLQMKLSTSSVDPKNIHRELELIEKISMQGAETVKRIQDFAGVRKDMPNDIIDITEIIRKAIEITSTKWKDECEALGIQIKIKLELEDVSATAGNAYELTQVLNNLIFNAVEAMPGGGLLTLKTLSEEGWIRIDVSDTGMGMSSEIQEKIFEPFFTTKETGHGLGMSVVYGIIQRHQGEISVSSTEGSGSTFTIKLPKVPLLHRPQTSKEPAAGKSVARARILVIEDDDQTREIFHEALRLAGHHVSSAGAGSEGLEIFQREEFDLVITDLSMSGLSGLDVTKRIKNVNPMVPIILVSGWVMQQNEDKLREAGVKHILFKPCPIVKLQETVETVLRSEKQETIKGT